MKGAAGASAKAGDLDALQERLGYHFKDVSLLDLALTHRSRSHEAGHPGRDNETLEFLGDAVIGLVIADHLVDAARPPVIVGALSRRRASLVSEISLAEQAAALGIGEALRLGKGEEGGGGRGKPSLLSDAFEAVIGAIYLDGGLEAAREFILTLFRPHLATRRARAASKDLDPKTRLQETLQANGIPAPIYRVIETEGPAHERRFTVEVVVEGKGVGRGSGSSKKSAGVEAARSALRKMKSILASRGAS